ncbi:MAG: hypothetical protein IPL74_15450 [Bacteroidetes bacterium]|nr:hypothetical protein [Bacteroidota bacterium]
MGNSENNNKELTVEQIREIAAQLRNPTGEKGIEMGHIMNEANVAMIDHTFETLQPVSGESILEIGHGNAHHLNGSRHKLYRTGYFRNHASGS